ncbi:MAG: hypothetical protein COU08_04595 [Candidatus Harrisonbacteria bacterium CG10_big_fil_rev_8_21_14_0_10_42_17]|uniref:Predicted 3'-5' exonuclease PolB-like domain-containing protein n=1 Tax=Candidatus Harrisonbacteria bacterium CG10_big_fil_rev_8_21_14_0_10_42_17 TaxID=1974584 RepID=A0A2M6WH31_9BACT|nr:MAG: hypothetical protein COU08_04595 [Candidatus Harrisonbacteria bacterium CG10_big_fil_rev_8_21_14_0_10_42_17]
MPKKLIFDIETAGESFDAMDKTTQSVLTRWIKKEAKSEEDYAEKLGELKDELVFSPLTGSIVAIGVLDVDKGEGAVFFQGDKKTENFEEDKIRYRVKDEVGILEEFWRIAGEYEVFITFNGRGFDAPFMNVRSAIHNIKPTKNLLTNRYLQYQPYDAQHIDLQDQLTFYGAMRKKGALHVWARAFGIKSPKEDGVSGDDVTRLFNEKKYLDIARYNARDLWATKELFEIWNAYLRF